VTRHPKTARLIAEAATVLAKHHPMTLRQVYYQVVSRQVSKNSRSSYQALSRALVEARREGLIPWDWIEDRLRRPRHVSMFSDPGSFARVAAESYRRDVWATQQTYVEVWLEKDALSGIFEEVLESYGVTLNVGRGYDGWASLHNAAERYRTGRHVTVLYFGDFDPSGEDMVRSLVDRLADFGCKPDISKVALTREDIERYNLPPDFTKRADSRRAAFVAKHGDISVELDALPIEVLRARIVDEVEARIDLDALADVQTTERRERERLVDLAGQFQDVWP
jgi:hypothetical protein